MLLTLIYVTLTFLLNENEVNTQPQTKGLSFPGGLKLVNTLSSDLTEKLNFLYNEELQDFSKFAYLFPKTRQQHLTPSKKCFDDLGCFFNDENFYDHKTRPFDVLPSDRKKINTRFLLYTKENEKQFHEIKANNSASVENSEFNPYVDTKFIVHGYMDNQLFGTWMIDLKDELLMNGDYNVIIVDWSGGNGIPYAQATANTRVVGAEIALMINFLNDKYKLQTDQVHIIGHSLGSHIAGYAGEKFNPKLGRITGLDPADPLFTGTPAIVRLDPTDAKFVDVIHSDSQGITKLGFGMSQLVGHVDFFPNGGYDQPGCGRLYSGLIAIFIGGVGESVRRFSSCNHQRSVDFMINSINNEECEMVGYTCKDYVTFEKGLCTDCGDDGRNCATLGLKSINYKPRLISNENGSTTPVKLYLKTTAKSPFCAFYYQVTVKLLKAGENKTGNIYLTLRGKKDEEKFNLEKDDHNLAPGGMYNFLVTTSKDLGEVQSVTFQWNSNSLWLFSTQAISLEFIKVVPLYIESDKVKSTMTKTFCKLPSNPIVSKKEVTFDNSQSC